MSEISRLLSPYNFCIQLTFNNPIKACFSDDRLTVSIQTRLTQIKTSIFYYRIIGLKGFIENIVVKEYISYSKKQALIGLITVIGIQK